MTTAVSSTSLLDNLKSYVPDVVTRYLATHPAPLNEPYGERFPAAVFFADISGFTRLTERLAQRGSEGVEALSDLLNAYFGQLIDIVLDHDGDIVEFTGDGIIALWPIPPGETLTTAVLQASTCGMVVQQQLAAFALEEGVTLSLRISIGAGEVLIAHVGGILGRWELLVAGDPLIQVGACEQQAEPGDVVLSPAAWSLVHKRCAGQPLPEGAIRLLTVPPETRHLSLPPVQLTPDMIPAMGGFLPGVILNRLEAGLSDWLAELRHVTVMFINVCDLNYDAPDIVDLLHQVMRALQGGLYQYEGSVNQFIVDDKGTVMVAAMGLPPLTHEDDAVRGVQAALAMRNRLRVLGLSCVVGIATGRAFCGARGSTRRRDYAMIGDVMNMAARLMQLAETFDHGDAAPVLCDTATYEGARIRLAFEELPAVTLKGKAEPVPLYRPLGQERVIVRRQTAMIGRETERALLRERLEVLRQGESAGIVLIEGDTGMGKSRLVSDFVEQARTAGATCLVGIGDAVEQTTSYHAWRPIFTQIFNLESAAGEDILTRRIRVLNQLWIDPETARLSPLINAVLPLDIPENRITAQMSGQVRAENTRTLLLRILQTTTAQTPTLLVLDEAHWLDSASWALALLALQHLQPLLLVVASRPMQEPLPLEYRQLRQRPDMHTVMLDSLAPDETINLVCKRLGVDSLPEQVASLIVERAQGNPFFSEELAYAMRDAGLILIEQGECRIAPNAGDLSNISFPMSVQGVVMSRIDRLVPSQQLTLKVASVIGQIFALRILNAVYPLETERPRLPEHLSNLEQLNITSLAAQEPDLTYIFKHIIIQEVVYNLLLFSQRRELHRAVAEWHEQAYADDLSSYYPLLAYHWHKAEAPGRAIDYLEKAGEQALRSYANYEAAGFFEEVLTLAHRLPDMPATAPESEDVADGAEPEMLPLATPLDYPRIRQARWERQLGEAYLGLGRLAESREHLERAVALLQRPLPTSRRKFTTRTLRQALRQSMHRLHTAWFERGTPEKQAEMLEAARAYESLIPIYYFANEMLPSLYTCLLTLNLTERTGLSAELARAYANMCLATGSLALHPLAEAYARQAMQTAEQVGEMATRAYVLNNTGLYNVGVGKWQAARVALEECVDIADQLGDRRSWGASWTLLAQLAYYEGDFARAAEMFAELSSEAQRTGDRLQQAWALGGQGQNLLRLGLVEGACRFLEQANAALSETPEIPSQISNYGLLAIGCLRQGNLEQAEQAAQTAAEMLETVPIPAAYYLIEGYAGLAETYLTLWETSAGQLPVRRADVERRASQACDALNHYARLFPIGQPRALLCRGLHAWLRGHADRAHRFWQHGLGAARRLEMPFEAGMLHYEIGRHQTGKQRQQHLGQAAAIMRRLGALGELARVEALYVSRQRSAPRDD
jgi:predicted ATPase